MNEVTLELDKKTVKILTYLLSRLEKRIYFLRVSLYGDTEKYFPYSEEILENENDFFKNAFNLSADEYRHMVDSCDIERCIRRILHEIEKFHTFKSLKDIITELESEEITFKKHQKMIQTKERQIEQLKEVLSQEQSQVKAQSFNKRKHEIKEKPQNKLESFCESEFLKKLMAQKVESTKNYYDYKRAELEENIESFERETRIQAHVDTQALFFWLLKYDTYTENLDNKLKEVFDNWAKKEREYKILKKYRKLNLERIQRLHNLISEREDYIEEYRIQKEKEQKKREEELRREYAATTIQAYWRGTMVRKHLGPYKIKKQKKKGKKGQKGKKKK